MLNCVTKGCYKYYNYLHQFTIFSLNKQFSFAKLTSYSNSSKLIFKNSKTNVISSHKQNSI